MAIHYCGVAVELREVMLKNKPQAMLAASPKGTVPVLVDGDCVIDESIDVMAWALEKCDPDGWLCHCVDHDLIQRNDREFKSNLDRYKYFDRYPELAQSQYFDACLLFLNDLESQLVADAAGHYFLETPKVSTLDIAIFPFIRQFAFVDKSKFDTQNLPKLQNWLAFFLDSSLFLNVMSKYSAWQAEEGNGILLGNIC